ASPSLVASYHTPGLANGIAVSANYAYLADGASGLLILKIPSEIISEDYVVVSQEELAEMTAPAITEGEGSGNIKIDIPLEEYLPRADEFVAVEEMPVSISLPTPVYPPMAMKAQIEGSVWVKVLVDRTGNVRDAVVVKPSGANAGFEEAALEAAKKGKWRPAIQNKQPVAVWLSYDIKFNLNTRR
ncbi:MAG: TonB family protein, partial [candidate division Zixibacteria bacterium]|nr:TonB family protein [candidate division Zixibacteria bacterium]